MARKKTKPFILDIPRKTALLYAVMSLALIPWIIILAFNLPERHIVRHWDSVWVGFDILLCVALVTTAILAWKHKVWVIMSASALGTMLVMDAWFDIMTARKGREQQLAIVFSIIELSLAGLTFWFASRIIMEVAPKHETIE